MYIYSFIFRADSADLKIIMLDWISCSRDFSSIHSILDFADSYMEKLGLLKTVNDGMETEVDNIRLHWAQAHTVSNEDSAHSVAFLSSAIPESSNEIATNTLSTVKTRNVLTVDLSSLLIVVNKCDMADNTTLLGNISNSAGHVCCISCKTGQGMTTFMELLVNKIKIQ